MQSTRMERQSCLTDRAVPVVADTSVLINLNATTCAEVILDALPNPFLAVSEVILELKSGEQAGRDDAAVVDTWQASGRLQVVRLGSAGTQQFVSLVSGAEVGLRLRLIRPTYAEDVRRHVTTLKNQGRSLQALASFSFPPNPIRCQQGVQAVEDSHVLRQRETVHRAVGDAGDAVHGSQ